MSGYRHVLVAADLSACCDQVVAAAIDMAAQGNAKVSLLHVVQSAVALVGEGEYFAHHNLDDETDFEHDVEIAIGSLAKRHNIPQENITIVAGSIKRQVVKFVDGHDVDLVVVGAHGHHGIGALLGSQANAILHAVSCDLLTVRVKS